MKWNENVVRMGHALAYHPLTLIWLIQKAGANPAWTAAILELQWKRDTVVHMEASCPVQINYTRNEMRGIMESQAAGKEQNYL